MPEHLRHLAGHRIRVCPGEHLIEHHTQGVDIRPRVDQVRVASGLLRAHVGQRPHDLAGNRDQRVLAIGNRLGQAEIQDAQVTFGIHQQVAGLEIAVDDSLLVRMVHGIAGDGKEFQNLLQAQLVVTHILRDRYAADIVHHIVQLPGGRDATVENDNDVGMPQVADQFHFPLKALLGGCRGVWAFPQHLQCDVAVRGLLYGLVDDGLPTPAKLTHDRVSRYLEPQ